MIFHNIKEVELGIRRGQPHVSLNYRSSCFSDDDDDDHDDDDDDDDDGDDDDDSGSTMPQPMRVICIKMVY